ncbi:MAG: S8 family serine peptidase [Nocardioidaceae bacterium]
MSSYSCLTRSAAVVLAAAVVTSGATQAFALEPGGAVLPAHAEVTSLDGSHEPAAASPTRETGPGIYIVTLTAKPSAVYDGGVRGYPATKARKGRRFDRTRPAVSAYEKRLLTGQDRILQSVGDPAVLYRYTTAVNGFAVDLTSRQVKQLRGTHGVALVERSTKQSVDSDGSGQFLGLGKTWRAVGGPDRAGRGTVIGVLDTGIWPENPGFAGLPQPRPGVSKRLPGFHGVCKDGEQWDARDCNDKVVSARYFVRGFGRGNLASAEFLSPRDGSGHGSHTAYVSAGNDDVGARIEGQDFGQASGMAPGARIAAYKICWAAPNPEDDGCTTPDAVAAIDRAVADGVDVINYAVSGTRNTVADSVQLAFLNASVAGVFVAASAGNSGPGAGTVAHPSPWVTTVGASSHRLLQGSLVLGNGQELVGAMVSDKAVPRTSLVLSSEVAAPGVGADEARICEVGSLDSAKVQGRIVVCDRGTTARVDKSAAVARAGGAAMVLANVTPDGVEADFHSVPTVHLDRAAAKQVKAYVADAHAPTASIDPSGTDHAAVPQVAGFSARGPSTATDGDILKPDLTAPGVGVLAAVAPPSDAGRLWDLSSGTSMSTAHVAGLAALVVAEKPTWSPARVKSAMMTTAYDVEGSAGPFSQGAGHVDPTRFLDPGLVFDATAHDYAAFLAGQGFRYSDGTRVSDRPVDASNLNLPSIAVGDLTGTTRLSRRVTNVSGSAETFHARVTGLNGVSASVQPQTLELGPGESARFTVVLTPRETAQTGTFAKGELTWTGLTHSVTLPVVARPELVSAPVEVIGSGTSGSVEVRGVSGAAGPVSLGASGLVGATPLSVSLAPGAFDPDDPSADEDTASFPATVPTGTEVARFQLDGDTAADDMDLYVYRDGELVAQSAGGSVDETVTLVQPEPGEYTVYVSSVDAADGSTTRAHFYSWVVSATDALNLQVEPGDVGASTGSRFGFEVSWTDLSLTERWFGAIRYGDSDHRTLVTVR